MCDAVRLEDTGEVAPRKEAFNRFRWGPRPVQKRHTPGSLIPHAYRGIQKRKLHFKGERYRTSCNIIRIYSTFWLYHAHMYMPETLYINYHTYIAFFGNLETLSYTWQEIYNILSSLSVP